MKYFKILFFIIPQIVFSQIQLNDLSFQHLTINEGLSQNTVVAIAQDSTGYIWFGTRDGLNRYDGYSFKQYFNDIADSNSLTSNEITTIDVAPNGIIWIGTTNGLNSFNPKNEKFENYFQSTNSKNTIVDNHINIIIHNSKNEIFIGTDKGLSIFSNGKFTSYKTEKIGGVKKIQIISSIVLDIKDNLWIGGTHSLTKFDRENNIFQKINLLPNTLLSKEPLAVQGLLFNTDSELWVGTRFGVVKYDINNEKVVENLQDELEFQPLIRQYLRNLFKDKSGNIWFAEWSGLRIFDKKLKKFISYTKSKKEGSLNSSAINFILEDKSGVIWVGTSFGGVNYFDPTKKKFATLNQATGLSNDIISSIAEDKDGNIWIGTIGGGLNRIDKASGKIEILTDENSGLVNNLIRVIKIDNNNLWFGDWGNNLTHLSLLSRKVRVINLSHLGFSLHPSNAIKDIEIDDEGNVWVATSRNGVFKFNKNMDVENFSTNSSNCLGSNMVKEIFFDRNKTMWLITDKGLSRYSKRKKMFKCITFSDNICMTKTKMFSVYVNKNNIFWIGTNGNGLLKIDIEKEECTAYTANKNIPNNVVYGILPDSLGNLWLSTNNGIAKFNTKTGTSISFNIHDGLQSNEFNDNAFCKTSDGRLLFGGIAGLNIISPSTININKYIPPVVITDIKFLNSSDKKGSYIERVANNTLTLNYNQTDFYIEFSALNFSQSLKNKYAYKLEPSNKEWISLENGRSITFTNLKHGKYTLKIKGSNNDGIWNEKGTELNIVVLPPFWLRWWFITILFIIVVGIISLVSYLKVRALIRVEKLRTKIASDLHDDVGASLTKISMNASLLNYETKPSGIKKRVESLNILSQEVISMMSDIVWSIDARNDTVQDMIDRMKNFAFNNVAEKGIDVSFKSDCSIDGVKLKINVRQNIYLIFKEGFHNAVKYSNSEKIDVLVVANNNGISISIVDNGIGLIDKKNNLGNGLRNMKMRAERINGKLDFINKNGLTISLNVKSI